MNMSLLVLFASVLLLMPWMLRSDKFDRTPEMNLWMWCLWHLNRLYCGFWHRLDLPARDPLPPSGPVLLIANHTCNIDHMLLQSGTRRVLGFIIAQEFYDMPAIHWICRALRCIPVKRDGRDMSAIRASLKALESGQVVPIFPEGKILPESGEKFLPPLPGAAWIALRTEAPVMPAFIHGTPRTNEIPNALATPSHSFVRFGPPIPLDDLRERSRRKDHTAVEAANERMFAAILALRDDPTPPVFCDTVKPDAPADAAP